MEQTAIATPTRRPRKRYGITPEPPDVKPAGRYTTSEAAERLNLHRNTITNLFNAGLLRAIDPNADKLRYSGKELYRFWEYKTKHG